MVRGQLVLFLTAEYCLTMWTIVDDSAVLKEPLLSARLPLGCLSDGLVDITFQGRPLGWKKWMGISGGHDTVVVGGKQPQPHGVVMRDAAPARRAAADV